MLLTWPIPKLCTAPANLYWISSCLVPLTLKFPMLLFSPSLSSLLTPLQVGIRRIFHTYSIRSRSQSSRCEHDFHVTYWSDGQLIDGDELLIQDRVIICFGTGILLCKDWSLKLSSSYRTCYQFEYHPTHACVFFMVWFLTPGICCNLTSENSERPVIRDRFRLRIFRPQDLVSAHDKICRHATSAPPTSSTPLNDLELAGFLCLFSFFFF
jgi:hypothetical protein